MCSYDDEAFEPGRSQGGSPTHRQIAKFAYEIWLAEGRPEGYAIDHWVRSELMLAAAFEIRFNRHKTKVSPKQKSSKGTTKRRPE